MHPEDANGIQQAKIVTNRKDGQEKRRAHQNQHVWDGDNIRLIPHRHGGLKVVGSVLPVGHCVVGVKCDVVFLDAFSEKHFERKTLLHFMQFLCLPESQFKMLSKSRPFTFTFLATA